MDHCPNPRCGCNLYRVVGPRRAAWWGDGEEETRECDHCRTQWDVRVEAEEPEATAATERYCVIFKVLRCPYCEGKRHHVTRTVNDQIRYHRCDNPACGKPFKSISS